MLLLAALISSHRETINQFTFIYLISFIYIINQFTFIYLISFIYLINQCTSPPVCFRELGRALVQAHAKQNIIAPTVPFNWTSGLFFLYFLDQLQNRFLSSTGS